MNKKNKHHIISIDEVFKLDPNENIEDNRPLEIRKKPQFGERWS